ncbi:MAG: hypothetical protein EOP06_26200 [Proteobacteria bacterium]|nr:MAG: hypothetical protein EOP06_26200 [Pseudomonadota bacterium]
MSNQHDPVLAFDNLYDSIVKNVFRFGRLATFDYLTMIGNLGIASVRPGTAYITASTGPLKGAQLLFGAGINKHELELKVSRLDSNLNVGAQVLEDALCNWQKSPNKYIRFNG